MTRARHPLDLVVDRLRAEAARAWREGRRAHDAHTAAFAAGEASAFKSAASELEAILAGLREVNRETP